MGSVPRWYALLRAAKYLGCAPWELAGQEPLWLNLALAAEGVETRVERKQAERAKKQRKRKV
jgi:hypothetical protein